MKKIALIGNPNVGKSTIFNTLTGTHQHTGNWPGKTVGNTAGYFKSKIRNYAIYDNNSSDDEQSDNEPGMKFLDKEQRQKSLNHK